MGFLGDLFGTKNEFEAANPVAKQDLDLASSYAKGGLNRIGDVLGQLENSGGVGKQNQVFSQQQALANQLQQGALGQGPNPALAQLAQATQQNTANQAALMAGQRGSAANSGMLARQAAMQGGANQQQMAGQSATLQAQQQLAQQQALAQQQQAMAGLAGNQVSSQLQGANALTQGGLGLQSNLLGANAQANQVNAQTAAGNQKSQGSLVGGLMGGVGSLLGMGGGKAFGGEIMSYADGGSVGPSSSIGKFFSGMGDSMAGDSKEVDPLQKGLTQFGQGIGSMMGKSNPMMGQVGGLGSSDMMKPMSNGFQMAAHGGDINGRVPGKVPQGPDSLKNDNVPAQLTPGEYVVKKTIAQQPEVKKHLEQLNNLSPEQAKKFVSAVMAKKHMGLKKGKVNEDKSK